MHYKIIFSAFFLFISTLIQAQKLSYSEKSNMVKESYQVELNSATIDRAKKYAQENNFEYVILQKNFIHLRVIYNEKLDRKKRIAYALYLLDLWEQDRESIPDQVVRKQLNILQAKNTTND